MAVFVRWSSEARPNMDVREVHASCAEVVQEGAAFSNFDPVGGRRVTDVGLVRGVVAALV